MSAGWFVTVAGNTGFGKTILALAMATSAVEAGYDVGFVSLEMAPTELQARLYRRMTEFDAQRVGQGASFDRDRMHEEARKLEGYRQSVGRFYTNPEHMRGLSAVLAWMDEAYAEGVHAFFVDYLQIIGVGNSDTLHEKSIELTSALRAWGKERHALVVGLSQFNRVTASNYAESPTIHGLKNGFIEEASDQVMMIDHARFTKDGNGRHARTWLLLGKNRYGPNREIPVLYDYAGMSVREGYDDELRAWPSKPIGGK